MVEQTDGLPTEVERAVPTPSTSNAVQVQSELMDEPLCSRGGVQTMYRRARRRGRQKLRVALQRDRSARSKSRGRSLAAMAANASVATDRPVAPVTAFVRDDVSAAIVEGVHRPVASTSPEYYAPTITLTLHPDTLVVPEPQVDSYLYLTRRFLIRLRRGLIPNPVPLARVEVLNHNDDFPNIPALVFDNQNGPGGTNVVFYDQP